LASAQFQNPQSGLRRRTVDVRIPASGGIVTRTKGNLPGLVILHNSFLNEGDNPAEGSLPLIPPVDLYETQDFYVLNAELQGVESEDVHVEVSGSELSIWGERKVDPCCSDESYHRLEGIRGRFHRTFSLPEALGDDAGVNAVLKDGVLRVELTKSSKSKKIPVEGTRAER
jgi:HSP20 family protein